MMRKMATSRQSKTHNRQSKNKTHFSLCVCDYFLYL